MMRKFFIAALSLFFVACSFKPWMDEPEAKFKANVPLNECLEQNGTKCDSRGSGAEVKFEKEWWKIFNDKNLNALVSKALTNSTDLRLSYLRFEQAAASLGINRSDLLPKVSASAGATRAKTPKNVSPYGTESINNSFNLGLNLSYELDL